MKPQECRDASVQDVREALATFSPEELEKVKKAVAAVGEDLGAVVTDVGYVDVDWYMGRVAN